jgi:RimJ/RimL family protein N-acetyltransferase
MIGLKKTDERTDIVWNPDYCEFDEDSVEFFEDVESWYDIELDGVKIGSCIMMEYHDGTALLDRLDIDEQYRCKGYGTEAIEALKRIRSEKDGCLYCAAESERCSHLYDRIGRQTSEDPWCNLDQGFGVYCLG